MKNFFKALMAITFIFVLMLSFSCAKKQVQGTPSGTTSSIESMEGGSAEEPGLEESVIGTENFQEISDSQTELKTIFKNISFDYDDFSLRPDAKDILNAIAEWMLQNTASYVLVEGHCDDRGTNEYNLALGERRAKSAKKYLVQLGVSPNRVATISYGEEKPLDTEQNENAWTKNRRDHFLIR